MKYQSSEKKEKTYSSLTSQETTTRYIPQKHRSNKKEGKQYEIQKQAKGVPSLRAKEKHRKGDLEHEMVGEWQSPGRKYSRKK